MKSQYTTEQETYISRIQSKRNISRKAAITFCKRHQWTGLEPIRKVAFSQAAVAPAKDVKMAQANDAPLGVGMADANKQSVARVAKKTDAGTARSVGIQDFILAGRPSKADFIAVYGPMGPKLTWVARAALGVDATHFQKALKSGKCVAPVTK